MKLRRSLRLLERSKNSKEFKENVEKHNSLYSEYLKLYDQILLKKNPKEKTDSILELYEYILKNYHELYGYIRTHRTEDICMRFVYQIQYQQNIYENQMNIWIFEKYRIKTKYTIFQRTYKKIHKKGIALFHKQMAALCPSVILNDDVLTIIFCYL
jgi:hypothetical protein